ncbi:MAG: EamA family transporter [Magnetococcales bacterium]|nr:EamA family transporter [Magnetococcales bacterium]
MKPETIAVLLVIVAACIEGFAHVCLKKSLLDRSKKGWWMAVGILTFIIEAAIYTLALQGLPIAAAYTLGALAFVATAAFSWWLLGERMARRQWLGLGLIMVGCTLVAL